MSFFEHDYREIITKAVCSRGKKQQQLSHHLSPRFTPSTILGCWIINHTYEAKGTSNKQVEIKGSYDIHVWYAYEDHTKTTVMTENVHYTVEVPLSKEDEHCLQNSCRDILAKVDKQPTCLQCKISDEHKIEVKVDVSFIVNVIGEMKVHVKIEQPEREKTQHTHDHKGKKQHGHFHEHPSHATYKR